MPVSSFRVRFAPLQNPKDSTNFIDAADSGCKKLRTQHNSRDGCRECKFRRVKCDEQFPVCGRCHKNGRICKSNPPATNWKFEQPGLIVKLGSKPFDDLCRTERDLLQWWLEKASYVVVIDPVMNPLSLPVLQHLALSPALGCALQSLSAAHKDYFDKHCQARSLERRHKAIKLVREELAERKVPYQTLFFAIFILGVSTSWVYGSLHDYGRDHLLGARAILDLLLFDENNRCDFDVHLITGYYLYWDMSCAFLVEPGLLPPLNRPEILSTIENMQFSANPFAGCLVYIFYLLGTLLRYCRQLIDGEKQDTYFEQELEEQLLCWEPKEPHAEIAMLGEAYRLHGLILFLRICRLRTSIRDNTETGPDNVYNLRRKLYNYAIDILNALSTAAEDNPYFNIAIIPLLTASAELTAKDVEERDDVINELRKRYARTRIKTCLWAAQLLHDYWRLRDSGAEMSYLEFMLQKGWSLTLV